MNQCLRSVAASVADCSKLLVQRTKILVGRSLITSVFFVSITKWRDTVQALYKWEKSQKAG